MLLLRYGLFMKYVLGFFFFMQMALCKGEQTFPLALDHYLDRHMLKISDILKYRLTVEPLNAGVTLIFLLAIIHTFLAGFFKQWAHALEEKNTKHPDGKKYHSFGLQALHFLGEIEIIFGLWIIPLALLMFIYKDGHTVINYIDKLNYNEPLFVMVIMAIASTRPVLWFAEKSLERVANLGKKTPLAWWFSILTLAPLLGSFITEPAAMTIGAILLGQKFYKLQPSTSFKYATLGLLFVNISVGGTLTHFAAPPVLMVAHKWGFDLQFMFFNIGWKALLGIVLANSLLAYVFRKEFRTMKAQIIIEDITEIKIPYWIVLCHLMFLGWTVFFLHHTTLYIGGFLFFLGFMELTKNYQNKLELKTPLLVAFFLAGLVTHGSLQQWWIEPVLAKMNALTLFFGATVLTSFNDNAAITYLASLVPSFHNNLELQKAVVEGAVTGGGLTVIANAPNPAGQSILSAYFKNGVSALYLFLGALVPTILIAIVFRSLS